MRKRRLIRLVVGIVTLAFSAGWGKQVSAAPAAARVMHDSAHAQATSTIYLPLVSKAAPNPVRNPGFEAGRDGSWDEYSSEGYDLIMVPPEDAFVPHSGSWGAWLGGADNETSILTQTDISLAGVRYLHFWYWIASNEDPCSNDLATVSVNGNPVATYGLCMNNGTDGWVQAVVDLNAYAGVSITLAFEVTTNDSENSNFFLDDVSITNSASPSTGAPLGSPVLSGAERLSKADFE